MFLKLGLNDGVELLARISPVLASMTVIKDHCGSYSLFIFLTSVSANLWMAESMVRYMSLPSRASILSSLVSGIL